MLLLFPFFIIILCITSCNNTQLFSSDRTVEKRDSLTIHEGIFCNSAKTIVFKGSNKKKISVRLSKPVLVAQAEREESWGFFQFPSIGKTDEGELNVEWQMADDSHMSFGKKSSRGYAPMISSDKGSTWTQQKRSSFVYRRNFNVYLDDGDLLQVRVPSAKDIHSYKNFPTAVSKKGRYSFYPADSLPEDLKGAYFSLISKDRKSNYIHSKLYDPGLLRYAIDDFMPVIWWGNIKQLADKSLIAGMHPTYYLDNNKKILPSGVSFYQSIDKGKSWNVIGKIPWKEDKYNKKGYDEPAFELLKDSTLICVMRTGHDTPMYKTFSKDKGRTWTSPIPFTPNGVMPRLLLLNNGVLVLASGRPGIQVRFSFDGTGRDWTEPIDMIHFMNRDGSYNRDVSCGYASIIEAGDDSFYIVYSDFTTKNSHGEPRKSIWFRKVEVKKR